jgi:hypothetical protein
MFCANGRSSSSIRYTVWANICVQSLFSVNFNIRVEVVISVMKNKLMLPER